MNKSPDATKERRVPPTYDKRGNPEWKSTMSSPSDSVGVISMVPDRIIPVIFVPGVMGSNLTQKGAKAGDAVTWRLDDAGTAGRWALVDRDAKFRKRFLQPEVMEVDKNGAIPQGTLLPDEELRRRGWGEVGALSYAPFLVWLEDALHDYSNPQAGQRMGINKADLQLLVGASNLTEDEIGLSYRYRFPVHACGYNWLDDNGTAAKLLGQRINDVIARYKAEKRMCEKVIIVTHSMGGLVARHCSEVLGYRDKIFGIVHGVMPAIGAAAVYRRFKAGTEDTSGWYNAKGAATASALGNDAAEMTAVLAGAPGPLQLLPTPEYGNGWLKIKDGANDHSLPKNGDPYSEIYTVRGKWWSMAEDRLINPLLMERNSSRRQMATEADWEKFADVIHLYVKPFHLAIKERYHPNTHAFIGNHADFKAYGTVTWSGESLIGNDRPTNTLERPGKFQHTNGAEVNTVRTVDLKFTDGRWFPDKERTYSISEPDEDGDGTVPLRSGKVVRPHCKSFIQAKLGHEPAFKHGESADNLRACRFTLRAIVKIAQEVKQTSLKYD